MSGPLKPRIAWFAPYEGAGESVSRYATELLLPLVAQETEIEFFHDGFQTHPDVPSFHYLSAFLRHQEKPFDAFFYQVEDAQPARFLRIAPALLPGVVWYHDIVFSDHGPEPILNSAWQVTVQRFGDRGIDWAGRQETFERTGLLGDREAALCHLALFSSERDHHSYRSNIRLGLGGESGASESYLLPLPLDVDRIPYTPRDWSIRPQEPLRLGLAASPRVELRVHKILNAVRAMSPHEAELLWLVEEAEVERANELTREFDCTGRVEVRPGRSLDDWVALLPQIDVGLHLHFSAFGESDHVLAATLVAGKPALTNRVGAFSPWPEQLVFQIDPGEFEATQIRQVVSALRNSELPFLPDAGRRFAIERHDHRSIAAQLVSVFRNRAEFLGRQQERWHEFEAEARSALLAESKSLLQPGEDRAGTPVLDIDRIYEELGWIR